ncbi:hypothetical protein K505DRAFT_6127 [Melanomma pulvis-pyrius CBS 109.77]|uniref:Uncharacterized protein n=1 Tax=Melanomma pulvis-pyrius CBS 109.77 TaxID=1314802 RepID=A0A6A6XHB6_9PLEO|nr:hypothetical protein K505DRAFT_6127 [Melanomma pulvis-pyrius CBS 109.77]
MGQERRRRRSNSGMLYVVCIVLSRERARWWRRKQRVPTAQTNNCSNPACLAPDHVFPVPSSCWLGESMFLARGVHPTHVDVAPLRRTTLSFMLSTPSHLECVCSIHVTDCGYVCTYVLAASLAPAQDEGDVQSSAAHGSCDSSVLT